MFSYYKCWNIKKTVYLLGYNIIIYSIIAWFGLLQTLSYNISIIESRHAIEHIENCHNNTENKNNADHCICACCGHTVYFYSSNKIRVEVYSQSDPLTVIHFQPLSNSYNSKVWNPPETYQYFLNNRLF